MNPHIPLMYLGFRSDVDYCVHFEAGAYRVEWLSELPRPTDAQIAAAAPAAQTAYAAAQAAYAAAQAARATAAVDKAELKAQFLSASTRLDQIINAAAPNNAQVITAVRDMATIQKRILRALYGIML